MSKSFLNHKFFISTKDLSLRWGIPETYLASMRDSNSGPEYIQQGDQIEYSMVVIENYEKCWRKAGGLNNVKQCK